jgi:hypothetical protein
MRCVGTEKWWPAMERDDPRSTIWKSVSRKGTFSSVQHSPARRRPYTFLYLCKIKQRSCEGGFLTSGGCRPLLSTISLLKSPAAFSRALLAVWLLRENATADFSASLWIVVCAILASRSCPARDRSQLTTRWSDDTNAAFSLTAGASACLPSYVSLGETRKLQSLSTSSSSSFSSFRVLHQILII